MVIFTKTITAYFVYTLLVLFYLILFYLECISLFDYICYKNENRKNFAGLCTNILIDLNK